MIRIGEKDLSLKEIYSILFEKQQVSIAPNAIKKVEGSFRFLNDFSKGKLIYGINTGFGPMAQYKIADRDLRQLQFNLIRSHCSGSGPLLSGLDVKSLMLARLSSLAKGYSGIHKELVILLQNLINNEIFPCVYSHGGVGASGDLVQLAHLALCLIGEGEVLHKGKILDTKSVFKKEKIKALTIHNREGISILNGTSAMTGIGLVNLIYAKKLLNWSMVFSTMITEIVESYDDHFSEELNFVKKHPGQQKIAFGMRKISKGSKLIRKRNDHLYNPEKIEADIMEEKVQEYYSLRCVPQILGPILDTIEFCEKILLNEVNSVNDNPVIDQQNKNVYHGGNFHGDYVALEMDKLKIAITKLAILSERQLNFLLNDKLNQKLTPFLNLGKLGLNYGIQGMQFTATSTTAECQTLSMPAYIHSIPNNNDNQDIVSMGANAAMITRKVIDNAFEVLAIQAIAVIQAADCLDIKRSLSPFGFKVYQELRKKCPIIIEDRPIYKTAQTIVNYLKSEDLEII